MKICREPSTASRKVGYAARPQEGARDALGTDFAMSIAFTFPAASQVSHFTKRFKNNSLPAQAWNMQMRVEQHLGGRI